MEMSERYSEAKITGIDSCRLTYIGSNAERLTFLQGSLKPPLPFDDMTFDLVHCRAGRSLVKTWDAYLSELYRVTAPDGWINVIEVSDLQLDKDAPADLSLHQWFGISTEVSASLGLDHNLHLKLGQMLQGAGYSDIKEETHKLYGHAPHSCQSERLTSKMFRKDVISGITRFGKEVLDIIFGADREEENQSFLKKLRKDLTNPAVPWYMEVRSVIGKRPRSSV